MHIQKINFLSKAGYTNTKKEQQTNNFMQNQNYSYNPIGYYKDYNISFGERLLLTPEEFYPWKANKEGLPEAMKLYLNADYDDRQHIPPQQMFKIVYDDLNDVKSLEQAKRIFPEEPLFKNLKDNDGKKATHGILYEIRVMRESGKSLFKNGDDNLGLYLLKKIYLEGKTLKEINEDFKKDVSVHYKGLSDIEYSTLRDGFGIKYPNRAFWKSFTHNRSNYKYEYKPRNPHIHGTSSGVINASNRKETAPRKGRFSDVKDWEIDKLTDALVKGNGSLIETKKQMKKSSVRDEAALGFVAKYMSEINSVVLERLQVSPEMSMFFENTDNLSKSQKQKLDAYWQDSERRELRSIYMKDTITWFLSAYGVDGQNEEFQELLNYAHNIKPNRIAKIKELEEVHNLKQAYYDEMFAELDALENSKSVEELDVPSEKLTVEGAINKALAEVPGAQRFTFETDEGTVEIFGNLREELKAALKQESALIPTAFADKFIKYMVESQEIDDSYILSKLLYNADVTYPDDDRLMDKEEYRRKTVSFYNKYSADRKVDSRAAQQATTEMLLSFPEFLESNLVLNLFDFGPLQFLQFSRMLPDYMIEDCKRKSSIINSKFNEYRRPLTEAEVRKVTLELMRQIKSYDASKSIFKSNNNFDDFSCILTAVRINMNNLKNSTELFKIKLANYVRKFGGSARYILDKNIPEEFKLAKGEQILASLYSEDGGILASYAILDKKGLEYIMYNNPDLYNYLNQIANFK